MHWGECLYLIDEPYTRQNSFEATARTKFESVNMGTTNSVFLKMAKKNMRFNVGGLYSDYADYQLANGKYLKNSRYFERGAKASFGVNKREVEYVRKIFIFQ